MNALDKLVAYFSPMAGLKRRQARAVLAYYEAGQPSRLRGTHRARGTQNESVQRSARVIRDEARFLCLNHDIARGILKVLVNNVVGPKGISVEPQPRRTDGSIHAEYAESLMEAYRDWCRVPEVTQQMSFSQLQRAMARAWIRDGEVFGQMLQGPVTLLDHGTRVPFSLEAFEADLVPYDKNEPQRKILQGIERNTWGKPVAIHVLKTDAAVLGAPLYDTKRVPYDRALHIRCVDNIGQIRGVSEFASVITRLDDIKDYEESERVAAKIAAMLTAYVKKGTPDLFDPETAQSDREISFKPGMVIDDLAIGEDVGMIDSKRPNPNLITFRAGQLRAVASGVGASNSSVSKDYNGTYSAQRQELVEQWIHYAVLTDEFVSQFVQPVWERFVQIAHLSGVVQIPADVKTGTEDDAIYIGQAMPWIDPMKEAMAAKTLIDANLGSEIEFIRKRGANPHDVLHQRSSFRQEADRLGVQINTSDLPNLPNEED